MTAVEVLLLISGGIIFVVSFLIPQKEKAEDGEPALSREQVQQLFDEELKESKLAMREMVDETVTYSVEKAERAMERISNEKLSAVSEFSDTVLSDINKNRDEVMFLYDMLNDKHENLKKAAKELHDTTKEALETSAELKKHMEGNTAAAEPEPGAEKVQTVNQGEEQELFVPLKTMRVEKVSPNSSAVKKQPVQKPKVVQQEAPERVQQAETPVKRVSKRQTHSRHTTKTDKPEIPFSAGRGNHNEKILQLHSMNKSNLAIAKELGLGVGEVKLVVDLYKGM